MENDTYKIATKLAADLAEDYLASNIADMMIEDAREKAAATRKMSEDSTFAKVDQLDPRVQEFRAGQRAIYGAVYSLIEGYKGYKLIKNE